MPRFIRPHLLTNSRASFPESCRDIIIIDLGSLKTTSHDPVQRRRPKIKPASPLSEHTIQSRLGGRLTALMDERPKYGVVEVVYVRCDFDAQLRSATTRTNRMKGACYEPVSKIITDHTLIGTQDIPAVKRGRMAQRCIRKISEPVEYIARCEIGREAPRVNSILRGDDYRDRWVFGGES